MENLSINLLTQTTNKSLDRHHEFSLYSLAGVKQELDVNTRINNMIQTRKEKRKNLLAEYNKLLSRCIDKICVADSLEQTEYCYDIPRYIAGCTDYKPSECLDFIQNKLRELDMDTYKINNTTIIVSWLYIELNRHMKKQSSPINNTTNNENESERIHIQLR